MYPRFFSDRVHRTRSRESHIKHRAGGTHAYNILYTLYGCTKTPSKNAANPNTIVRSGTKRSAKRIIITSACNVQSKLDAAFVPGEHPRKSGAACDSAMSIVQLWMDDKESCFVRAIGVET
jgi:hypothetical protein